MSRVPESHGERLAPYVAAEESVITGCVEEATDSESDESKTTIVTDTRLVRLTVTDDEERITSVPFAQVASASVTVVDAEKRQPAVALAGLLLAVMGLAGLGFVLVPSLGVDLGAATGSVAIQAMVIVAAGALFAAGLVVAYVGYRTDESEVHLELTGVGGTEAYSTVLARSQIEFAQTVSRLVGTRSGGRVGRTGGRTHVDPADD